MLDVDALAQQLTLGGVLGALGEFELIAHWTQGEFHHDVLLRVPEGVLVLATNCNGGVKEVLLFDAVPERDALWHSRCPDNPEFEPRRLPHQLARATTLHWFPPCELLSPDARSELRPEFRQRQRGGGWKKTG